MTTLTVHDDGKYLAIQTHSKSTRFHAIWLRDNAWDSETRAVGNGQRLLALRDIPANTTIATATINGEKVTLTFAPEGKSVDYPLGWLMDNAYDMVGSTDIGWTSSFVETWSSDLMSNIPVADFAAISTNDHALKGWLEKVARYGFGKLENGPVQDLALMQVVDLFGFVRETNYGRHFEVRTCHIPDGSTAVF